MIHKEIGIKSTVTEIPYIDDNGPVEGLSIYTIFDADGHEALSLIDIAGQDLEDKKLYNLDEEES
jgi:hypothetical protein